MVQIQDEWNVYATKSWQVRGKITEEGKKGIQEGSEMISSMSLGSNFYFLVTETIIK